MARVHSVAAWLVFPVVACACSSAKHADEGPPEPDGWVALAFSAPSNSAQCSAAAPTAYTFGSEQKPLSGQVSCAIHDAADAAWVTGHLAASRGTGDEMNLGFTVDTMNGLALSLVTDGTGTLELEPSDASKCAPTATAIIGNDFTVDFDCPLLVDPNDATSACGMQGEVSFENCGSE